MHIIGEPIGAVEFKVLTSQTHTYKLGRVRYVTNSLFQALRWREDAKVKGSRKVGGKGKRQRKESL